MLHLLLAVLLTIFTISSQGSSGSLILLARATLADSSQSIFIFFLNSGFTSSPFLTLWYAPIGLITELITAFNHTNSVILLAISALKLMQKHSITSLFVFSDINLKKPDGLLHIHDVLKTV